MHFPDVHANDIVLYGSGSTGGDWKPLLVTKVLHKTVPRKDADAEQVPYAVEGIMWARDGAGVTAFPKDVVYPLGCEELREPSRYELVNRDPRYGVFILGPAQVAMAELRQQVLQLKETVDLVTA